MKAAPPKDSARRAAWLLLILNVADITVTFLALQAGAHEGNPLAKFLIDTKVIIPLKFLVPGYILFTTYSTNRRYSTRDFDWLSRVLWFLCGLYSLVVVLNLFTWNKYA